METEWDSIPCDGGAMDVFMTRPTKPSGIGLVMLQEIFGVIDAMRRKAEVFAEAGFTVAVPDLLWRLQHRVELSYGPEDRQQGFALMKEFDLRTAIDDVVATGEWLASKSGIAKVSVVGFCLGGGLAVLAGATGTFAAVGSFYGVQLDQNLPELDRINVPLQIHVGDHDAHVPMAVVERPQSHLLGRANASVFVYPGAQHGFCNERRDDVYDAGAASLARDRAFNMLNGIAA